MLTHTITGLHAWHANAIDEQDSWYYPLSERCLEALDESVRRIQKHRKPLTEVQVNNYPCADYMKELLPVLQALEAGRGFAIINGVSPGRYSPQELQTIYWLVGQLLGRPFEQNVQGTLLYDVRDTGQDVRYGARFSITNAESTFHTDNSFGAEVLDYVGLLCLNTARSGGLSQVISGYSLHNELLTRHADILPLLYEPFHVDRRGGVQLGEPPTVQFPIMHWDGRDLLFRYLRYWIEVGQEKAGQPLTSTQVKALDILDSVAAEPELRVEFALKPGDMFFINNRWILHNRTAFEDHEEPQRKRHYVRLWLKAQR